MNQPRFDTIGINAFRGLTRVGLEGLARINLLVGANNTGKTSVLEAIQFLCDPLSARTLLGSARGRTENGLGEGRLESFRWMFPNRDIEQGVVSVVGVGQGHTLISELRAKESREMPRRNEQMAWVPVLTLHPTAQFDGKLSERSITLKENARVREVKERSPFVPCATLSSVAHRTASLDEAMGLTFVDGGLPDVFDVVRCLDPAITDIRKVPVDGVQSFYVERTGLPSIPLNTYGDGLRRVLSYAARIVQCRDGVLLIDEIETAIHISAFRRVYDWLLKSCKKYNVQLIATTHSLETLDAILASIAPGDPQTVESDNEFDPTEIPPEGAEDLVVFRLDRKDQQVLVKRLSGSSTWDLRYRGGLELR